MVTKNPPAPKPYGPGKNMQLYQNIFVLLGALNDRVYLKHKSTFVIYTTFYPQTRNLGRLNSRLFEVRNNRKSVYMLFNTF